MNKRIVVQKLIRLAKSVEAAEEKDLKIFNELYDCIKILDDKTCEVCDRILDSADYMRVPNTLSDEVKEILRHIHDFNKFGNLDEFNQISTDVEKAINTFKKEFSTLLKGKKSLTFIYGDFFEKIDKASKNLKELINKLKSQEN